MKLIYKTLYLLNRVKDFKLKKDFHLEVNLEVNLFMKILQIYLKKSKMKLIN